MASTNTRVLVVDDDPGIRQSFADFLEDLDFEVDVAEHGLQGLERFGQHKPDVVILDLRMPVMGGLELLQELKARDADTPLIVVSGTGRISDAVDALKLGAWDYLLKPVEDLSVLEHTVRQSVENARLRVENRRYQQQLESLVEERTKALAGANLRLKHLNERLRTIVNTTSTLSSWLDMREFGPRLLREFARNMDACGGSLYVVHEDRLQLLDTIDPGHAPEELPLPLPEGSLLGQAIATNQAVLVGDVRGGDAFAASGWQGYSDGSALIFPIADAGGNVAALLTLHNKKSPPFVEQDREIGMILSSYSCESLRAIRTFEALSQSERRFRELADLLPQSLCETDANGMITYANQQACVSFGYSAEELTERLTIDHLIEPVERTGENRGLVTFATDRNSGRECTEFRALRKNGTTFPVLVYATPITHGNEVTGLRVVAVDITVRKRQEQLILRQAHYDGLTGLPNRFLSLDRLSQLIKEARRTDEHVAVLFLDLDDFKRINDTLGHEVGDQLLIQASRRLRDTVRDADTIGRLGGDEFILMLGGLNGGLDAKAVAEHVLTNIRRPFLVDNHEMVLTASLGVSVFPEDGDTPAELLRKADTAMYHAKSEGRNTWYYFTSTMNDQVSRRLLLEQHLHGALGSGELEVWYQPVIELAGKHVIGFEALLRWNSPTLGAVSPMEFIPVAEQTGLIMQIGSHVLHESVSTLVKLRHDHDPRLRMAVNLSPRQFRDPDLPEQIRAVLRQRNLPGDALELEITEGVLLGGSVYTHEVLDSINQLGVSIAMDDFGTGYSSLSYLQKYPFDTLKIDRTFVSDLGDAARGARARELVNAAIVMAHGLGLKVIAEGVETREQMQMLEAQQCDYAQGYLLGRPQPYHALHTLFRDGVRQDAAHTHH